LVLPCGAAGLASSEAGASAFFGAAWPEEAGSGASGRPVLSEVCWLDEGGAGACGMADEETQNKPAIAQGKSTRTKKLLNRIPLLFFFSRPDASTLPDSS
jgi:hypothetical protein